MPNQYGQNHRDENTYRSYERERGDSPNAGNDDRRNDWSYRTQPERSDESRHRGGSNESYASYGSGGSSYGEGYGGSGESRFEQRFSNDQRHGGGFGGGQYGGGQYGGHQGQYGGGQYGGGQYRNENRYGSNYGGGNDRNDRYRSEHWGNEHHAGAGYGNENMREREIHRPERFGNAYGGGYHSYGEQHGGENRFAKYYGRDEGMSSSGRNEERWNYDARFNQAPHDGRDQRWGDPSGNRGMGLRDRQRGPHFGKGPQGFQRSDERIKEMVSEALADHDELDATNIHVEVKSGEVTLTGTVEDRRDKRLAEDCVERVTGVKDVQNQLRVGTGSKQDMSSSTKTTSSQDVTSKSNQAKLQH